MSGRLRRRPAGDGGTPDRPDLRASAEERREANGHAEGGSVYVLPGLLHHPAWHHLPRSVRGSGPYRAWRRRSPRTGTVLRPRSSRRRPATSSTSAAITREYRSSPGCTSRKMQANAASLPAWALASMTPKASLITGPVSARHTPWRRPNRHLRRLTVAAATELVPLRGLEIPVAGNAAANAGARGLGESVRGTGRARRRAHG
jgi:hypothetical protein